VNAALESAVVASWRMVTDVAEGAKLKKTLSTDQHDEEWNRQRLMSAEQQSKERQEFHPPSNAPAATGGEASNTTRRGDGEAHKSGEGGGGGSSIGGGQSDGGEGSADGGWRIPGTGFVSTSLGLIGLGTTEVESELNNQSNKYQECALCRKGFSIILRRPHRCRSCQKYFCQPCSPHRIRLRKPDPERVCGRCYIRILDSMHGDGETSTVVTGRPGKKGAPDGSEGGSRGSEGGGGNSSGDAATKEETESTPYSELEKSGNYDKYFRMLKMGIQRQAIGQKMVADEIPSDIIAIFKAGPKGSENISEGIGDGAAGGPAGRAAGREWKKGGNQQGRNNSRKPSMRQIQWNTLDKDRAEKSVFGTGSQISAVVPAAVQTDERLRLQELFGTTDTTASVAGAGGAVKKKKRARVAVIDSRRANNVSIMLKQFQKLLPKGYDDIVPAVLRLDPVLTPERLQALVDMCPSDIEVKRLLGFRGEGNDLIEGEKWMLSTVRLGMPRLNRKIEAALTRVNFEDRLHKIAVDVELISSLVALIMGSERLRRILEHLLVIGLFQTHTVPYHSLDYDVTIMPCSPSAHPTARSLFLHPKAT